MRQDTSSLAQLRQVWRRTLSSEPPAFRSRDLLQRALLYEQQTAREGGHKSAAKRRLTELAQRFAQDPDFDPAPRASAAVGSALVRDWNGARHVVLVTAHGFQYGETLYPSLTHVARAITGTHQSGPRFFGLAGGKAR